MVLSAFHQYFPPAASRFFPEYVYLPPDSGKSMPTGLKTTSSPIQISSKVTESAANAFTNLDVDAPDAAVGVTTLVDASISSTARTAVGDISNSNVIASANRSIIGLAGNTGYAFDREDPLFSAISEDYLAIVATNNMFLNIQGTANGNAKSVRVRVYGYRASASSSVYAALVQSELLSA